ncbi:MAG: hypothetical protein GF353_15080 [Candidatus Lokiarchaeota archaeon]|nr:hypothetical protein [Candidatus Lokiarchaeota archaeon]
MVTTLIFAELLIVGFQVILIILLIILTFGGHHLLMLSDIKDWQSLLTLFMLASSYTIGTMFDRFTHYIFSNKYDKIKETIIPNPPYSTSVMRSFVTQKNDNLNLLFEYTRSKIRLSRATAINMPFITLFFSLYFLSHLSFENLTVKISILITILIFGVSLSFLSFFSWKRLVITYFRIIQSNYEAFISKNKTDQKD